MNIYPHVHGVHVTRLLYEVNSHDNFDSKISIESNVAERLHISNFSKTFANIFNIDELIDHESLHFNCLQNMDLLCDIDDFLVNSIRKRNNSLPDERHRVQVSMNANLT